MKKIYNKLCAIAFALLGATSLSAQTDVTSTYLTNAGFDDESGWATGKVGSGTISTVIGWVGTSSGDAWYYGGALPYGSSLTVNDATPPSTNPDGVAEGGALGLSAGWGCTAKYTQAVTLPAGVYTLTYKAYNANTGATQANNYIGFTCSAGNYYGTISNFTANTWVEESINYVLTSETSGNISVGMGAIRGGSGANAKLFVDGVTLSYTNFSDVTAGNPIDLTSMGSGSWTGQTGSVSAGGVSSVSEAYTWGGPRPTGTNLSKAITGLPVGKYNIEVYCASSTTSNRDNTSYPVTDGDEQYITLTANSESVNIPSYNRTTISGDLPYYTFNEMVIQDGNLNLAMNVNVQAPNWLLVKVKSITFLGPDKTLSEEAFSTKMTSLKALDSSKPMPASISTELTSLISEYGEIDPVDLTQSQLDVVNGRMDYVINNYDIGVAEYTTIKTYINKANTIDASITTSIQEAYDNGSIKLGSTESVFQELEVATYNYVKEEFSYPVKLSDNWNVEGPTGSLSAQHWSGETRPYLEQSSEAWGQNSWTIKYDQNLTLPAGEYVFKVAGRKAAGNGCTLSLTVTSGEETLGTVNDFPEGDRGLGINKNGETSFNAEDEAGFANDGAGRGWQWRYVKFALPSEATVNIAVNAEATIQHQWVSFCDATVQMTEETYLEANQAGLDAVLVPAQALYNSKPMGDDENSALQTAINMPVTTGAEMLAKIDALTTAVANANAWVAAYNEAKAPLVAEMDRFEADYNDGVNGCKEKLYIGTWNALITEVGQAAVAKDVTNSYDGFAAAKEELTAAIAAVDASIAVYKNLKKKIDSATAYVILDKSQTSDHEAAIAAATSVWENGSKEDPTEEIIAMQQVKVSDYNYVATTYQGEGTLGEWTGKIDAIGKGQHWSGDAEIEYFDHNAWGDKGTFTVSQEITLPKGTYVLKAAGRCANVDGTEVYMMVNETKVYFDMNNSEAFGIETNGQANFSAEGTYTNDDKGYGWEYRFIEFTLNEEQTVTIGGGYTVVNSTNPLSWVSLTKPQLLAKKLDIIDKKDDFENETEEGYYVSYDRVFATGTYTTVMVPFDYDLPGGVVAEKLNLIAFNGPDNNWISFENVTKLNANTPYILKNNSATAALFANLGIKTVYSTASTNSVEVEGATMKGTYKEISAKELVDQENGDIIFINADGRGKYIDDEAVPENITFPAGRAYIVVDKNTFSTSAGVAPKFTIFHGDDDLNSIEETVNVEVKDDVIYDLAGRRIVKPTKAGIYIVNGKKMIIK